MGIKYLCDLCGKKIKRNYVTERLNPGRLDEKIRCEVIVAINGAWNDGVFCENHLRKSLLNDEQDVIK